VLRSRSTSTNFEFSSSFSRVDLVVLAAELRAALLGGADRGVLRREHAAVDVRVARHAASAPSTWSSASVSCLISAPSVLIAPRRCQRARREPHRVARGTVEAPARGSRGSATPSAA